LWDYVSAGEDHVAQLALRVAARIWRTRLFLVVLDVGLAGGDVIQQQTVLNLSKSRERIVAIAMWLLS
jgi:hypothetical protein